MGQQSAAIWCDHGLVARVVPGDVAVAEAPTADRTESIYASERALIEHAVDVRRADFSSGRACAHEAMVRLGARPAPVLATPDRAPTWPTGLVGSIAHTRGFSAAAVARASAYASVGIDIEVDRGIGAPEIGLILTEDERDAAREISLPAGRAALYCFSAKEAFFKCQFPITGLRLGFHDAVVRLGSSLRSFRIEPIVALPTIGSEHTLEGRFATCCGLLASGMVIRNGPRGRATASRGVRP